MIQRASLRKAVWSFGVVGIVLFLLSSSQQGSAGDPTDGAYWVSQAQDRIRQGDREGALKAFQQAAWLRPQEPAIHYNMGVLAESLGRAEEAVGHYTAYLRWAPQAEDGETVKRRVFQLCGNLGAQAYQDHQLLRALDWYEKARDLYPYAKAVHFNMSRVYEARGDWRRSAACLKEYHALCSAHEKGPVKKRIADHLRKQGEAGFQEGDYDGALADFQEAARWDKENNRFLLDQAMCEERLGLLEDAKNHYLAYLQVDPTTQEREAILERVVQLHASLARDYLTRGYLSRAQDILDKGLEIDPENRDLHELFAQTYIEHGQNSRAVAHLERILELSKGAGDTAKYVEKMVQLCTSLADEAYRAAKYPEALRFLKKALLWDPDSPLLAYNLARVYERENEWQEAILAYRRYLFLDPEAAERNEVKAKLAYYYSFLGTERFDRAEYAQAQEAFEQALLVQPEDRALLYNLAVVLLRREKTAEALHFLERYLKSERDPQEIERVQRQITSLVRLTEEKSLEKTGKSKPSDWAALDQGLQEGSAGRGSAEREQAFLLLQAGQWQEASRMYEACLLRFPSLRSEVAFQKELASAYREISRVALVRGEMREALSALEKAKQWAPAEAFPYLWQGSAYEHLGKAEEALRVYRDSLRTVEGLEGREAIRNRIVSILTQRLQAALGQEDLLGALETIDAMEPYLDNERAKDLHYQKARIEGAMGRKQAALVDYGLHLLGAPQVLGDLRMRSELIGLLRGEPDLVESIDDPSEAYRMGKESAVRGDHAKALFCFLVARKSEGAPPDLDAEIIRSLGTLRMDREAFGMVSRHAEGEPPFVLPQAQAEQWARRAESILWEDLQTGRWEKGLEGVRSLQAQLSEPDGKLVLLEGVFEEMIGNYEDAIERYERALDSGSSLSKAQVSPVSSRLCTLLIRKALAGYEEGDYEACLDLLRRADRAVPGRRDVAFDLGCVYLRLKNPNGALQAFSRYMELEGEPTPRRVLTGDAIVLLQRQLSRSPVVRYDGQDIAVDLIFERPVSLGNLLAGESGSGSVEDREQLLDSVMLAPYLELALGGEGDDSSLLAVRN